MLAISGPPTSLLEPGPSANRLDSTVTTSLEQILASPLEFVEGSSSGITAVPDGRYQPVNPVVHEPLQSSATLYFSPNATLNKSQECVAERPLHYVHIILHPPPEITSIGAGFLNIGNTCFLNSVLQCLLHIPPLLHLLRDHSRLHCRSALGFCAACSLREVMMQAYGSKRFISPDTILCNIGKIAKHFRRGRQEDAHEFLRYLIESLQKCCMTGPNNEVENKLAESSWVHRLFGGKLRSRVKCRSCGHPSDTFDSILDLSIDVNGVHSLKESLHKFVRLDVLKGADRYKCDKCKQFVVADKGFTLHEAPVVLTIHMKRFTPYGKKIVHPIRYEERLDIQPYMSTGQFGPVYRLHGVINHAGKSPNSGHYFAYVQSSKNRWYEMNDESVEPRHSGLAERNAYILFYVQEAGQSLRQFSEAGSHTSRQPLQARSAPFGGEDEDIGTPTSVSKNIDTLGTGILPAYLLLEPSTSSKESARDAAVISQESLCDLEVKQKTGMENPVSKNLSGPGVDPIAPGALQQIISTSNHCSPNTLPLKRRGSFSSKHLPPDESLYHKKMRLPPPFPTNRSKSFANPFGGRYQYKNGLDSTLPVKGKSSPVRSRELGIRHRMKRKRSLI